MTIVSALGKQLYNFIFERDIEISFCTYKPYNEGFWVYKHQFELTTFLVFTIDEHRNFQSGPFGSHESEREIIHFVCKKKN